MFGLSKATEVNVNEREGGRERARGNVGVSVHMIVNVRESSKRSVHPVCSASIIITITNDNTYIILQSAHASSGVSAMNATEFLQVRELACTVSIV